MLHAMTYNFKMFVYALYYTRVHNNYNDFCSLYTKHSGDDDNDGATDITIFSYNIIY